MHSILSAESHSTKLLHCINLFSFCRWISIIIMAMQASVFIFSLASSKSDFYRYISQRCIVWSGACVRKHQVNIFFFSSQCQAPDNGKWKGERAKWLALLFFCCWCCIKNVKSEKPFWFNSCITTVGMIVMIHNNIYVFLLAFLRLIHLLVAIFFLLCV